MLFLFKIIDTFCSDKMYSKFDCLKKKHFALIQFNFSDVQHQETEGFKAEAVFQPT